MTKAPPRIALILLTAVALGGPSKSSAQAETDVEVPRQKVGLVLSGGGARGGAHIGVLLALRDLRIPIDYIAGTSMGSVVGGLYATGLTEAELDEIVRETDWQGVFHEAPAREDRSFRRKRDDDLFLVKRTPGFNDGELQLPLGIIQGQDIDLLLNRLTLPVATVDDFDELSIPFRSVAADITTGEAVILARGNLGRAIRSSLSIPALIGPVDIDGRLLVDGGIAMNLPVEVAKSMGAEIVIAIDISTPLQGREEIQSLVDITSQLTKLLTNRGTEAQLAQLGPEDILIRPELGELGSSDFARITETIPIGYEATMAMASQLAGLSLDESRYVAHRNARSQVRDKMSPTIEFVRLRNESGLSDKLIADRLGEAAATGEPLDIDEVEAGINDIYGLQLFQNVRYDVVREGGQTGLEIRAQERNWGPAYLQFGVDYSSAGDDDSLFGFAVSYLRTGLNPRGGEWRSIFKMGDEPELFTEFHQPLGWNSKFFYSTALSVEAPLVNVFQDGSRIAQVQARQSGVRLAAGREFGNWGEWRIGLRRSIGNVELVTGDPTFLSIDDFDKGEFFTRFSVDTLDNSYFPTTGNSLRTEYVLSRDGLGAGQKFDQLSFSYFGAKTWERHTVAGGVRFDSTTSDTAPIPNLFQMGGLFNLAGFAQDQLSGQHAGRLMGTYYRRIGDIALLPAYVGVNLELGNVWTSRDEISLDNSVSATTIWVGADTPIGPFYIGYGREEGGSDAIYLSLGKMF